MEIGDIIEQRYRIETFLSSGGMGKIFLVQDLRLGRRCVLKVISEKVSHKDAIYKRFMREAQLMAKVEHNNVVRVYDFGNDDGLLYLIMAYIAGETLGQRLREHGALPVLEACAYIEQIANGLQAIHEQKIMHRDIKSDNIIISTKQGIKIVDFGLAKKVEEADSPERTAITMANEIVGSPRYMAPELCFKDLGPVDFRADIYSLGILFFEMLAGQSPFPIRNKTVVEAIIFIAKTPIPHLRSLRPEVPPILEKMVFKLTQKKPDNRYSNVEQFLQELHAHRDEIVRGRELQAKAGSEAVSPAGRQRTSLQRGRWKL